MKGGGKFSEQQYMYFSLPKSVATNRDKETSWKLSPDFTQQQIKQFHSQMRKAQQKQKDCFNPSRGTSVAASLPNNVNTSR